MTETSLSEKPSPIGARARKDPLTVLFLSFVSPGLGHLFLGRWKKGITFFLGINLLLELGFYIAGGSIFTLSGANAAGAKYFFLLALPIPELFNLMGIFFGAYFHFEPIANPTGAFSTTIALGWILSAISGMLCLFVMADAWTLAHDEEPKPGRNPSLAALYSWILPGAGHLYLRKGFKAWLYFVIINLIFAVGLILGGGLVVNREKFFYYWAGQFLNGVPTLLATILSWKHKVHEVLPFYELGLLYTTVAGLLNVIVMLSAYKMAQEESA